jgi:hypothetical protein
VANSQVKFWYVLGTEEQLTFEGKTVVKEVPIGVGHIVYSEVLMCKQSRERLKNEAKAKKHKVVGVRLHGVKMCEKCEEKYKSHPDLAWMKWVNPPEQKIHKPVEINPLLLEINNEKLCSKNT